MKKILLMVCVLVGLAGCAGPTPYVSSDYVASGGVVKLGSGREAPVLELCLTAEKLNAKAIEEIRKDPSKANCAEKSIQFAMGTTWERDVVTNTTPVVMGQAIQVNGTLRGIDKQLAVCKDGKCGGGSQAAAGASSSTNVNVNIGCLAKGTCQ